MNEWRRPDPALLRLRRVLCVISVAPAAVVVAVLLGLFAGPVAGVAALSVGGCLLGLALTGVSRNYQAWGYLERADDLLVRRGVLVRRLSAVPYGRMQYVDVTAGPLDRRFGLARVTLHTAAAASDASVPGLLRIEADRLRDRLAALGESRAGGV